MAEQRLIDANAVTMDILCAGKIGKLTCIDLIKKTPTIDAVPVVHGHWIEHEDSILPSHPFINQRQWGWGQCSCCHISFDMSGVLDGWDYCPGCGAKMDEVTDDG